MSQRRPKRQQKGRAPRRRRQPARSKRRSLWWRLLKPLLLVLALLVLIDSLYLVAIWPAWDKLARGEVPKSNFIKHYEELRGEEKKLPPLHWRPVPLSAIAPIMRRAVVIAEDGRFYQHDGFDTEAIQDAMEKNLERGKIVYGASTISQQTVKNMFLSSSRDYLRKWHEMLLTWAMERHLSKARILTIYLNVAEFGPGLYGVEAASRHYWAIPASALNAEQAAQLAACLPSPRKHNPDTNTRSFRRRVERIKRHMRQAEEFNNQRRESVSAPAT